MTEKSAASAVDNETADREVLSVINIVSVMFAIIRLEYVKV